MIDLKKFEHKVDSLLANETDESLFRWFFFNRYPALKDKLSKGTIQEMELFFILNDVKISRPNDSHNIKCLSCQIDEDEEHSVLKFAA